MGERKILASAVKKTSLKWVGCERLSPSGGRKRIRYEGVKGSNEEEEIAQRQKPANNYMWEGEYEKVLKERKSVQIYAQMHGKQLWAASRASPTSSLSSWTEKLDHSNKSILCSPPRERGCSQQRESGHRSRDGPEEVPWLLQLLAAALAWLRVPCSWKQCSASTGAKIQIYKYSLLERKNPPKQPISFFQKETKVFQSVLGSFYFFPHTLLNWVAQKDLQNIWFFKGKGMSIQREEPNHFWKIETRQTAVFISPMLHLFLSPLTEK